MLSRVADAEKREGAGQPAEVADGQSGLQRDIRELGALLRRALVRQEGAQLSELVEQVEHLVRTDREGGSADGAVCFGVPTARLYSPSGRWGPEGG